jgi:hypothetical protein
MGKRLRQGLWGLSFLMVAGLGSLGIYGYRQLTAAPTPIVPIAANQNTYQRHQTLHQAARSTVLKMYANPRRPDGSVLAQLSTQDLNAMFAATLAQRVEGKGTQHIVKGTQVERVGQRLKTTALLDLSQVSAAHLQGGHRLSLLRRLLKVPGLSDRTITISVEGAPIIQDRSLSLQDPVVDIGKLRLTMSQATEWLGISEEILEESFAKELSSLPIVISQVQWVTASSQPDPIIQLEGQLTAW